MFETLRFCGDFETAVPPFIPPFWLQRYLQRVFDKRSVRDSICGIRLVARSSGKENVG
jgi:hypothetical protein